MNRVLIVEDSAEARAVTRAFVQAETAFTICGEASNGMEAIEKAKDLKPDLVLRDLAMPLSSLVKRALQGLSRGNLFRKSEPRN